MARQPAPPPARKGSFAAACTAAAAAGRETCLLWDTLSVLFCVGSPQSIQRSAAVVDGRAGARARLELLLLCSRTAHTKSAIPA